MPDNSSEANAGINEGRAQKSEPSKRPFRTGGDSSGEHGLPLNQKAAKPQSPAPESGKKGLAQVLLLITIVYVAMNLRAALISVGPVIDSIGRSLGLSATALGVLITLPVLCFGAFAPFAPRMLKLQSAERLILFSLLLLTGGVVLRSNLGSTGLFAGTFLLGLAISVVMVLLPGIIKRHFPVNAGLMMGLYSTALAAGAAMAAGVTVPMEQWLGDWRLALGFWAIPALLAALAWVPQVRGEPAFSARRPTAVPRLRNNWLAWQVTLFMGTQGAIAYCIFGWLPLILIDRGLSSLDAGFALAMLMGVQLSTSITGPWIATRGRDQRPAIFVFMALVGAGFLGLVYGAISAVYIWAGVFGLGFGGMFAVAMALLVLRSPNPQVAAAISGMSQGVGYMIAAVAPLIVGILHEYTGDWNAVAVFMMLLVLSAMWSGLLAGRARFIE